jgi:hypothetical protein
MAEARAAVLAHQRLEIAAARSARGPACGRGRESGKADSAPAAGSSGGGAGAQERVDDNTTAAAARLASLPPCSLPPSSITHLAMFLLASPPALAAPLACLAAWGVAAAARGAHAPRRPTVGRAPSATAGVRSRSRQPCRQLLKTGQAEKRAGKKKASAQVRSGLQLATAAACATCMHYTAPLLSPHWHCRNPKVVLTC